MMKESNTNNRQHTHLLSDGIQGALLGPFELLHLDQSADFCLQNKPQWSVCLKPGALSAGFPAADTPEKMSASGSFPRFIFWHPCWWAPLLLGARRDAGLVQTGKSPCLVHSGGMAPSCGRGHVMLLYSIINFFFLLFFCIAFESCSQSSKSLKLP